MASCKETLSSATRPPERLVDEARDTLRFGLIDATSNAGGSAAAKALAAITTLVEIWIARYTLFANSTFRGAHPLICFFTNP